MKLEIKVPSVGESINSAEISEWLKQSGDFVKKGEILVVLETDKASMDLPAEQSGKLEILKDSGEVLVDERIGFIESQSVKSPVDSVSSGKQAPKNSNSDSLQKSDSDPSKTDPSQRSRSDSLQTKTSQKSNLGPSQKETSEPETQKTSPTFKNSPDRLSPAVKRLVESQNLNPLNLEGSGKDGRLTKADILTALNSQESTKPSSQAEKALELMTNPQESKEQSPQAEKAFVIPPDFKSQPSLIAPTKKDTEALPGSLKPSSLKPGQRREKMSRLRRVTAERLVQSQQNTASLSTFNEVDLSRIMEIRKNYQKTFVQKYGFKLGFMSFFVKSVCSALKAYPKLNAFVDKEHIIYNDFQHIGIAVSTDKGLVVPVLFHAEQLRLAQIEQKIIQYKDKALARKLSPDDLLGGTFTISNGGVFGSLLSTPILNPPQSGILGMHKIQERAVVIDGSIQIRPMMYLTLSYDHRIVDGRESVSFLLKVKEGLEDPSRLLIDL